MLHERDIEKFSNKNKDDFEAALHEHADVYPGLEEITTDLKKDVMKERAKEVIQDGPDVDAMSDEDKAEALQEFAEREKEAVVVPIRGGVMRFQHPDLPGEFFEINVFEEEMGESALTFDWEDPKTDYEGRRYVGTLGDPSPDQMPDEGRVGQPDISCTPVEEIPSWAAAQVFEAIEEGAAGLYENERAAQQDRENLTQQDEPIIGDPTGEMRVKTEVEMEEQMNGPDQPVTRRRVTDDFRNPSHQAAWNVLNETINGEEPLPQGYNAPVERIGEDEIQRVRGRIQRCLEAPGQIVDELRRDDLDERAFFNQLLRCEMQGWTPTRTAGDKKFSFKTRDDILRVIREEAEARGFEVLGDTVSPAANHEIVDEDIPVDFEDEEIGSAYT